MIKVLFWNYRGLKKASTHNYLQEIIRSNLVCDVTIMETQIQEITGKDVDKLLDRNWDFIFNPSLGNSGGMALFWCTGFVNISVAHKDRQLIWAIIELDSSLY